MLQDLECDEVFYTKIDDVAKTKARDFIHDADAALSECHVFLWKKFKVDHKVPKTQSLMMCFLPKREIPFGSCWGNIVLIFQIFHDGKDMYLALA